MTTEPAPILSLEGVRFGYPRGPSFLGPIDLTVAAGQCWGIVGPNGAGKSTLLRVMAGLLPPLKGTIRLKGALLGALSHRRRALSCAFLPQQAPTGLEDCVRDVVLMGRFPHRGFGLFESAVDYAVVAQMLEVTQLVALADRPLNTLSGGEAQRVHLAAALAQETELLLADEPTASLDLQHQLAIFTVLRERARQAELAVVVVTHDVNLAARFCTHVLLLHGGRMMACGRPAEVITAKRLSPVYGVELAEAHGPTGAEPWVIPAHTGAGDQP